MLKFSPFTKDASFCSRQRPFKKQKLTKIKRQHGVTNNNYRSTIQSLSIRFREHCRRCRKKSVRARGQECLLCNSVSHMGEETAATKSQNLKNVVTKRAVP